VVFQLFGKGRRYGSLKLSLEVRNSRYYKQPTLGVHSEQGILMSSPIITKKLKKNVPEISEINHLNQQIEKRLQEYFTRSKAKSMMTFGDVFDVFSRLDVLLKTSYKESTISFLYENKMQLLEAQHTLLCLAFTVHRFEEEDTHGYLKKHTQELLTSLVRRGELSLMQMRITRNETLCPDRIRNCVKFQKFVYEMLGEALNKLVKKDLFSEERKFVVVVLAFTFFLVPRFRVELLKTIDRADDPKLTEWRGTDFSIEESDKDFTEFGIKEVFDWENHFYKHIQHEERATANEELLKELLRGEEWRKKISRRGNAFFYFLTELMEFLRQTFLVQERGTKWH
jgi:hypothetical protein